METSLNFSHEKFNVQKKNCSHRGILTNIWFMFRIQGRLQTVQNVSTGVAHARRFRRPPYTGGNAFTQPLIEFCVFLLVIYLILLKTYLMGTDCGIRVRLDLRKLSHFLWWVDCGRSFINVR